MTVGSLIIELHEIPQGDQSQYTSLSLRILNIPLFQKRKMQNQWLTTHYWKNNVTPLVPSHCIQKMVFQYFREQRSRASALINLKLCISLNVDLNAYYLYNYGFNCSCKKISLDFGKVGVGGWERLKWREVSAYIYTLQTASINLKMHVIVLTTISLLGIKDSWNFSQDSVTQLFVV